MKDFLKLVADDLLARFGDDLSRVTVIFPNRRAGLFLNNYLYQDHPVWSPRYMSISDFFSMLSQRTPADPIDVICRLFKHYRHHTGSDESLDHFYGWGEQLMADFDDADKHMADMQLLFRDIKDYSALDDYDFLTEEQILQLQHFAGDFVPEKLTFVRENFNRLWSNAYRIYEDLRKELFNDNLAYEGMLFREVAENIADGSLLLPEDIEHVAIVGFNAIDKVEQTLFKELQRQHKALFYWDYDVAYAQDKYNEAGLFIRENLQLFPNALADTAANFDNMFAHRNDHTRCMEFASAPNENIQAQSVADWLKDPQNFNAANAHRTAIVLCNENLLQPVVQALPEVVYKDTCKEDRVYKVNVTKGFPFTHTPAYDFILEFIKKKEKETSTERKKTDESKRTNADVQQELTRYLLELRESLEHKAANVQDIAATLSLLHDLYTQSYFQAYTTINRFIRLVNEGHLLVRVTTLTRLLKQMLRGLSIPISGDPAVGLQIMGVLETRCLDFDNILMLSVNEGNLPQKNQEASFIPYLVRKMHGLTTSDRRVAVYSYYFHRLLQRAQRVRMVYNNSTEGTQRGEMSRFMRAILVENAQKLNVQNLSLYTVPRTYALREQAIQAKKSDEPLFYQLSPSALKSYFKCPMQFYFKYVRKLKTPQVQDPIINMNDFGTIFHHVAEDLFKCKFDAKDKGVTPAITRKFLDKDAHNTLKKMTLESFEKYNITPLDITVTAIVNYLIRFLRYEVGQYNDQSAMYKLTKLEKAEETENLFLPLNFRGRKINFKLYGDIDRLDYTVLDNNKPVIRVIDYKTGRRRDINKTITYDDFFTIGKNYPENEMQVLIYSLMQCKKHQEPVIPMLFHIPDLSTKDFSPLVYIDKKPVTNFHEIADEFEKDLSAVLEKIIDSENDFTPNEDKDICKYCDYKQLCGRNSYRK